nr:DUF1853 family protein [Marinimicrobium alkaliphilum]
MAWMCTAPQLWCGETAFDVAGALRSDAYEILRAWDKTPAFAPSALHEPFPKRLGVYFEQLYACLMTELLGWELLAKNLQIPGNNQTLGELDFIFRNPHSGGLEHHEIAVKYYLGFTDNTQAVRWYGPNSRDRLDLKTARLLDHQCTMGERPETRAVLHKLGLNEPLAVRTFMPGYLFYPEHTSVPSPTQADPGHERGHWVYARDLELKGDWVQLHKPHWLGPWVQAHRPLHTTANNAVAAVRDGAPPKLLAQLALNANTRRWYEQRRVFVVPDHWPGG